MAISGLPEENEETGGIIAEINVTPLTDIFLVLLIIFMVTTTVMQDEGKNIDLPNASESEETPKGVTVAVTFDGMMKVNDRIVEMEDLLPALEEAIEEAQDKIVILRGDKRVLLGRAVNILDLAQQAGAKGIALATQPYDVVWG